MNTKDPKDEARAGTLIAVVIVAFVVAMIIVSGLMRGQ